MDNILRSKAESLLSNIFGETSIIKRSQDGKFLARPGNWNNEIFDNPWLALEYIRRALNEPDLEWRSIKVDIETYKAFMQQ